MDTVFTPICRHHRRSVRKAAVRMAETLGMDFNTVSVVDSESALPEKIQHQIAQNGAKGEVAAVMFMDTIYIVSNRISTTRPVFAVFRHELTHLGANKLLGKATRYSFNKLLKAFGGLREFKKRVLALGLGGDMLPYFKTVKSAKLKRTEKTSLLVNEFLAALNSNHHLYAESDNKFLGLIPIGARRVCAEAVGYCRDRIRSTGVVELDTVTDADIAYILRQLTLAAIGKPSSIPLLLQVDEGDEVTCFFTDLIDVVGDK